MQIFDSHNHLHDPHLAPHLDSVLRDLGTPVLVSDSQDRDLIRCEILGGVVNGTHPDDWPQVAAFCAAHPSWLPAFGVHPWRVDTLPADWFLLLEKNLSSVPAGGGIGETGIDGWKTRANMKLQLQVFSKQWHLARERELPLTVHCLKAWEEFLAFLQCAPDLCRGFLLHAYGGPPDLVPMLVSRGAWFSFNGSFLGKPRKMNPFQQIPPDRLLIESDAPSMGPHGIPAPLCPSLPDAPDGTRVHHPASICAALAGLAEFLEIPLRDLAAVLCENHRRFWRTDQTPRGDS